MHICFCYVCFSFSVLSQEIGWEERLRNDLFYAEWDVKPQLNQSVTKLTPFPNESVVDQKRMMLVSDDFLWLALYAVL